MLILCATNRCRVLCERSQRRRSLPVLKAEQDFRRDFSSFGTCWREFVLPDLSLIGRLIGLVLTALFCLSWFLFLKQTNSLTKGTKKFLASVPSIYYLFWMSLIMLILIHFTFKTIIIPFRGLWKCVSHLNCLLLQCKQDLVNLLEIIGRKSTLNIWLIADLHDRSN